VSGPPRILHVDTGRELRGGQRQLALLAAGLDAAGCEQAVALPPGSPLAARLPSSPRLRVIELPLRGEWSLAAVRGLRAALKGGLDLVHAHTAHAVTPGHWARRGLGAPLVAHRRVDFPLRRHPLARLKRRWPDLWIAVSQGARARLLLDGVPDARITVVPSALDPAQLAAPVAGPDPREELDIPAGALLVGTVGNLAPHKGHAVLLEALAALDRPDARLLVAGDGPLRGELARRAGELGLAGRVHWLGHRDDPGRLLRALDLFIFPSLSGEGSPAALKEALALGVPVLASDLPAHREIGLEAADLAPAGDAPALAAAVAARLSDLPAARRRAADLRALADRFSPARLVEDTLAAYARLAPAR